MNYFAGRVFQKREGINKFHFILHVEKRASVTPNFNRIHPFYFQDISFQQLAFLWIEWLIAYFQPKILQETPTGEKKVNKKLFFPFNPQ